MSGKRVPKELSERPLMALVLLSDEVEDGRRPEAEGGFLQRCEGTAEDRWPRHMEMGLDIWGHVLFPEQSEDGIDFQNLLERLAVLH